MQSLPLQSPPLFAAIMLVMACVIAGCRSSDSSKGGKALEVATTVAPITSIVSAIGGDRVTVTGIIPEGTNSHTFEPRPSVAETLSSANVLYVSGMGLEDPTVKMAKEVMPQGSDVLALSDHALPKSKWIFDSSFPRSAGKPNPHLWTDPQLALAYAREVRDDLSKRDPGGSKQYQLNYLRFAAATERLDKAMRRSFATIPEAKRKLLTYHDGYAYFARDYGWKVIGAIQASDFEDPTASEVSALIDQIRAEQVPAIFGSEVFPSPVLAEISHETGVRYVDQLRDDDLPGQPGQPDHSLFGLLRYDYTVMTEAMGGNASALKQASLTSPTRDQATYPQ